MNALEITVDASKLREVAALLKAAEGGAELKKDLVKDIRAAAGPGVSAVKAKLQGMPSSSKSPVMGGYLASRVRVSVRLSGASAGVAVRVGQTPGLRGFKMAARRLNRGDWRHPVFGNKNKWVNQNSPIPGYFDKTLSDRKEEYRAAVILAVQELAAKLTRL